jgi:hypothetical protein
MSACHVTAASSGIKAVGYREFESSSIGAALLREMILLDSKKPVQ